MQVKSGVTFASIGAIVIAMFGASVAHGQTSSVPFSITCTSSGQLCTPIFTTPVTTGGVLQVSYSASAGHCSNVAAHFLVDGVELAVTPFLTPGQTSATFTLSPVSAGAHTLGVQGEGTVSGCNTGTLAAWGGSVQITVNATAAAAPIPAPGLVATALALLLAAFAYFRRRSA
jgi:hypothetical protein